MPPPTRLSPRPPLCALNARHQQVRQRHAQLDQALDIKADIVPCAEDRADVGRGPDVGVVVGVVAADVVGGAVVAGAVVAGSVGLGAVVAGVVEGGALSATVDVAAATLPVVDAASVMSLDESESEHAVTTTTTANARKRRPLAIDE